MFFTVATLNRHFCYSNVYDRKAEGRPASSPCRPCRLCGSLRAESDRPADGLLKRALEASWLVFVVIATFLGHTECFSAGPNVFSAPNVFYLFCPIRSLIGPLSSAHKLVCFVLPHPTVLSTMSSPVKLYVYDLSNGLAKQLSMQLTGKQIDGVWFVVPYP